MLYRGVIGLRDPEHCLLCHSLTALPFLPCSCNYFLSFVGNPMGTLDLTVSFTRARCINCQRDEDGQCPPPMRSIHCPAEIFHLYVHLWHQALRLAESSPIPPRYCMLLWFDSYHQTIGTTVAPLKRGDSLMQWIDCCWKCVMVHWSTRPALAAVVSPCFGHSASLRHFCPFVTFGSGEWTWAATW